MKKTALLIAAAICAAQVPYERIRRTAEASNWLTYSGNLQGHRYLPLAQINTGTVRRLRPAWIHNAGSAPFETSPIIADGTMFITEANAVLRALDARTGRTIWRYQHEMPSFMPLCCGTVNRGAAVLGTAVYYGTPDAYLVAVDARTGRVRWKTQVADVRQGYSITSAPLAIDGKIITGIAGGEFGVSGFLDAYDAKTGKRVWRFSTIPQPGEPGHDTWTGNSWQTGGVPTWVTGSYDPELNLVYWGTGNPGPLYEGKGRKGDNLYSNCIVAVDGNTGKLKWYFQTTPHDLWDYDGTQMPVLFDAEVNGAVRKLVAQANRNGFYYLLDRVTGEYLLGKQYGRQTWAKGLDAKGRPIVNPDAIPNREGVLVAPDTAGVTNWRSPSFDQKRGLLYVPVSDTEAMFYSTPVEYRQGVPFIGGVSQPINVEKYSGSIKAIRATTGEVVWEFPLKTPTHAGVMATAGGLVFSASLDGLFFALDAENGKPLWHFNVGGEINANPAGYGVRGTQYVIVPAGSNLISFSVPN